MALVPYSFLIIELLFAVCCVLHAVQSNLYPENPANASQPQMDE